LRDLVAASERILGASLAECAKEDRAKLTARFAAARKHFTDLYSDTSEKVRTEVKHAETTIHSHPYEAVALAFGAGALLGVLIHRNGLEAKP
jgi:ElaB/YqjD/DUF883 family membrane-anchored ribosome-binding protein